MAEQPERPEDGGFLSRWSQRKVQVRQGQPVAAAPPPEEAVQPVPAPQALPQPAQAAPPPPVPPTLEDVALLSRDSDFSRFVAHDVDAGVRNAALQKLFSDPRFNVMDGLDTYIDDYNAPDPLPPGMLRRMVQSQALGLFSDDAEAPATSESPAPNEDPDLRLQPLDAAGCEGIEPGAVEEPPAQP
jgi:hypothetical protein